MSTNELALTDSLEILSYLPKCITCVECKNTFIFSSGEQSFFQNHGLSNEPKRCSHCRVLMRMRREGKSVESVTQANCVECGEKTTVPFLPRDQKRIYCAVCYRAKGYNRNCDSRSLGVAPKK